MKNESFYLEIINNLCDGIYFVDNERKITFWNKAAEEITGYKKEEVMGKTCQSNILSHIDKNGKQLCIVGCPLYATIIDGHQRKAEVYLRHKEGHRLPVLVNIFPIKEENQVIGAIEIFTPFSSDAYKDDLMGKLPESEIKDRLTGLANRRNIESLLENKFKEKFCIILLDIDNFNTFNGDYGYETGNEMLRTISASMMGNLRKNDLFGRWGGDEFLGVFEIQEDYEAVILANKIRQVILSSQIMHDGEMLSVTASLGVTLARTGDMMETAIKRTESLMQQSKQNKKNCITSDID